MTSPVGPPPSWQIMEKLRVALELISPANGFYTAPSITTELPALNDRDAYPVVLLTEESSPVESHTISAVKVSHRVVAEGYIPANYKNAMFIAAQLKWDLTQAFMRVKSSTLNPLESGTVATFEITGDRPTLRRPDGMNYIIVQVRAVVTYSEFVPGA
ncbi:MAG: hypothetical protein ABI120_17470 [Gemmatimonadaceae bacterium]